MSKAPAMQFYPGDVLRDTALGSVSLAAYGLWHRMLWVMFDGTPYGHLSVNGSVIPPVNLARLLRVSDDELRELTAELESAGVFSRTPDGVIYSRRMVRDHKRRETNSLNGTKGGNPSLTAKKTRLSKSDNRKDNREVIPLVADANAVAIEDEGVSQGNERAAVQFEALWLTFDRYGSKAKALEYWNKLHQSDRDAIIGRAKPYCDSTPGCKYRKQLEGWINPMNRLWERPIVDRNDERPTGAAAARQATEAPQHQPVTLGQAGRDRMAKNDQRA